MSDDGHSPPPPAVNDEVKSEDPNGPINVKVVTSTGDEVFFKIKRNTKLSKLQGAYANKVGKDVGTIRFLYDGNRINDDDTPASLEMDDNDTIDVMVEQVGGSDLRYRSRPYPWYTILPPPSCLATIFRFVTYGTFLFSTIVYKKRPYQDLAKGTRAISHYGKVVRS